MKPSPTAGQLGTCKDDGYGQATDAAMGRSEHKTTVTEVESESVAKRTSKGTHQGPVRAGGRVFLIQIYYIFSRHASISLTIM